MSEHQWKFFRSGGVDQVVLRDGADIAALKSLDLKLWVALACPTKNLEIDARTLELLDSDKDGKIHPPEILAAIEWLKEVLKSLDDLFKPTAEIPIDSIRSDTDAGKLVSACARRIADKVVGLPEVAKAADVKFKGDELEEKALVDIDSCVEKAHAEFYPEAEKYLEWLKKGEEAAHRPLSAGTDDAATALAALEAKIDDWFTRAGLAAFDPRAIEKLNVLDTELLALSTKTLTSESEEVAKLPLARVDGGRGLDLNGAINPAWAEAMIELRKKVLLPLFGDKQMSLSEEEWVRAKAALAAHRAWKGTKPVTRVEKLTAARLAELAEPAMRAKVTAALAARDEILKELDQIQSVEKLIRFRRDFLLLLKNFVNFAEFYGRRGASFQAGRLYLDARGCDLVLYVEDPAKHATLAQLSRAYLAYCDCKRLSGEKTSIVAALTSGDVDNLMVGRNGIFYDRKGNDWDATITKIVENPISIRQAIFAPYKRFVRVIEEQVAKRASAKDTEAQAKVDAMGANVATADQAAVPAATPAPPAKKLDVGTIAAIGVAVGGIATFFSSILATFFGLGMWMPLGIVALLLAVSGPSMLIAWLKLRQRNIGPLLDANGWAVNARAKVNVPFGTALTAVAKLPKNSTRDLDDPFEEKASPWKIYIFVMVVLFLAALWFTGKLDSLLPPPAQAKTVMNREAPPPAEPQPPATP
jgi:hypothetical protein